MNYLNKKTVEDIDVAGKRVLVRCDFNVPFDAEGNITDPKRINEAMKTIKYLIDHKAKVILCSHLGRPKGEFNMKYSLAPVAEYLSKALGQEVKMAKDVVGESAKSIAASLQDGEVEMIENVRFHKEEEKNDPAFAKELASLAEIYVNDAFGTAHRAHASTAGVADYLPAVCGYLIQKEITIMGGALTDPKRPFVAILGGAKVSDKIGVITNLLDKVDTLIIGGGMAYTFMNALGYSIGTSICEADKVELAKDMMAKAKDKGVKFLIPVDNRVGDKYAPDCNHKLVNSDNIPDGWMGLDIGPKTEALFADATATSIGAIFGTSNTTTFVESAAGIGAGGRTGLTSVVVAICFALSAFLATFVSAIPNAATAPALIFVGILMLGNIRDVDFSDMSNALPAFCTIVFMPFTYSIANGVAFGLITYCLMNIMTGKRREVRALTFMISVVFVVRYAFMTLG